MAQAIVPGADPRPRLRRLIEREYGASHAVLCGSGAAALRLAIARALHEVGSECVALPAYTCFDVAAAAVAVSGHVQLYDLEPATLAPDLDDLERVLADGARVVVVSPLWGVPVDWEAIEARLVPYGAVAVEDAAQGHGAAWRGRPLGGFGRFGVLSFGRGKGWTGAAGGALLLRGARGGGPLAVRAAGPAAELCTLVRALAQWGLARPRLYGLPASIPWLGLGEARYREAAGPGELTRAAAALLEHARGAASAEAEARRANAGFYLEHLTAVDGVRPVRLDRRGTPGFLRFPVRLPRDRAELAGSARARRLGVAPGYPSTLAELAPIRARLRRGDGWWPGARELARRLVTLPTHSLLSPTERHEVVRLLAAAAR